MNNTCGDRRRSQPREIKVHLEKAGDIIREGDLPENFIGRSQDGVQRFRSLAVQPGVGETIRYSNIQADRARSGHLRAWVWGRLGAAVLEPLSPHPSPVQSSDGCYSDNEATPLTAGPLPPERKARALVQGEASTDSSTVLSVDISSALSSSMTQPLKVFINL